MQAETAFPSLLSFLSLDTVCLINTGNIAYGSIALGILAFCLLHFHSRAAGKKKRQLDVRS